MGLGYSNSPGTKAESIVILVPSLEQENDKLRMLLNDAIPYIQAKQDFAGYHIVDGRKSYRRDELLKEILAFFEAKKEEQ